VAIYIGYRASASIFLNIGSSSASAGDAIANAAGCPAPSPSSGYHYEVTKLGWYVGTLNPAVGETYRLALYAGATLEGADLIAEAEYTGAHDTTEFMEVAVSGGRWVPDSGDLWIAVKCEQESDNDASSGGSIGVSLTSTPCDGLSSCTFDTNFVFEILGSSQGGDVAWADPYSYPGTLFQSEQGYTLHLWAELTEYEGEAISGSGAGALAGITGDADAAFVTVTTGTGNGVLSVLAGAATGTATLPEQTIDPTPESTRLYQIYFAGDGLDDLYLPCSSLEMRLRPSPLQTYVQVTVPDPFDYTDELADREEVVVQQYKDGSMTEMVRANISAMRIYQGPNSASAVITAYKQKTWINPSVRAMSDILYSENDGTTYRYRLPVGEAYPDDSFIVGDQVLLVDLVTVSLSPTRFTLEVAGSFI